MGHLLNEPRIVKKQLRKLLSRAWAEHQSARRHDGAAAILCAEFRVHARARPLAAALDAEDKFNLPSLKG